MAPNSRKMMSHHSTKDYGMVSKAACHNRIRTELSSGATTETLGLSTQSVTFF